MIRTIIPTGTPEELEEIAQVRAAISDLPEDSEMRAFIEELLSGLELGLNMTMFSTPPRKKYAETDITGYAGFTVIPDTV